MSTTCEPSFNFQRDEPVFDTRVRSTMDVVECPGTISMRMISPPSRLDNIAADDFLTGIVAALDKDRGF